MRRHHIRIKWVLSPPYERDSPHFDVRTHIRWTSNYLVGLIIEILYFLMIWTFLIGFFILSFLTILLLGCIIFIFIYFFLFFLSVSL